jgi:uncharacterized protein YndB with AHSA1/START domain
MARLQGHSEQTIGAPASRIWEVLEDSSRLPEWAPVVERLTEHAEREAPGSVRRCEVAMGSRRGYMVERCLESVPQRRLRHAVEDDSLGFTKLFRDYSFTLELDPRGNDTTLVTCQTFYDPRGIPARLMNAALMRRKFTTVRRDILRGLKELVEGAPDTRASGPVPASAP